jgi:hypothetical protein
LGRRLRGRRGVLCFEEMGGGGGGGCVRMAEEV